jgi:hypothetical protein
MEKLAKLILAILLFICLLDMPYGYYELVRTLAFGTFIYLGIQVLNGKTTGNIILLFGLALLFQPFFKIALGRPVWNVVDVIVGVGLLISIFRTEEASS